MKMMNMLMKTKIMKIKMLPCDKIILLYSKCSAIICRHIGVVCRPRGDDEDDYATKMMKMLMMMKIMMIKMLYKLSSYVAIKLCQYSKC